MFFETLYTGNRHLNTFYSGTNHAKEIFLLFSVSCPEGTYTTGSATCGLCPRGTYNGATGQSNCFSCSAGQSTYTTGNVAASACQGMTRLLMIYSTRLKLSA